MCVCVCVCHFCLAEQHIADVQALSDSLLVLFRSGDLHHDTTASTRVVPKFFDPASWTPRLAFEKIACGHSHVLALTYDVRARRYLPGVHMCLLS